MNKLKEFIKLEGIDTIKVSSDQIVDAQKTLNLAFDDAYIAYLNTCGQLEYEYLEFYGLGVPDHSHVNVIKVYKELRESLSYPKQSLPLQSLGDGHYALYDLITKKVIEWCEAGTVMPLQDNLEDYLLKILKEV